MYAVHQRLTCPGTSKLCSSCCRKPPPRQSNQHSDANPCLGICKVFEVLRNIYLLIIYLIVNYKEYFRFQGTQSKACLRYLFTRLTLSMGGVIVGLIIRLPERMWLLVCRGVLGTLCHLCQHQRGVCHSGRLPGSFCGALSSRQRNSRDQDLPQWDPHQRPSHCMPQAMSPP